MYKNIYINWDGWSLTRSLIFENGEYYINAKDAVFDLKENILENTFKFVNENYFLSGKNYNKYYKGKKFNIWMVLGYIFKTRKEARYFCKKNNYRQNLITKFIFERIIK